VTIQRALKRNRVMPLADGSRPEGPSTFLELSEPKTDRSWRTQAAERLASDSCSNEDLVFTTPLGTPIDPSNLAKEFMAHAKKAGLGHRYLHQLRH
jgi:hypothetical protein